MDPMSILFPVLSVGGMGVVFGACLGVASEVFKVEEDPRIGEILAVLPGANCGGCGFAGCKNFATACVSATELGDFLFGNAEFAREYTYNNGYAEATLTASHTCSDTSLDSINCAST